MNQDNCWDYYQAEGIESFDQSYARLNYLANLLNTLMRPRRGAGLRVLNVGVGNGIFEELCIKAGREVWSLDPSETAIRRLEKRITIHAVIGTIQEAALPEKWFSAINMSEVLEHLPDNDLERAIGNVNRMLTSGGFLIGTVPYQEKLNDNIVVCPHCGEKFHRWGHHQSFTAGSLTNLLGRNFPIVKTWIRPFVAWKKLNWKGKMFGGLQHLRSLARMHGSTDTIVFFARKA